MAELITRMVYITYALRVEVSEGMSERDIPTLPEVTAPPTAEIIDWGWESAIRQV